EFTENASHELQTPLSVLRSKLELLADTDIQGDQAILIGEMQHAIEKIINRSSAFRPSLKAKMVNPIPEYRNAAFRTANN
ncbi:MAG: sensor histidine kinase, partial [Sphingobacteriales bacterium]